jgi:hypothetical protein
MPARQSTKKAAETPAAAAVTPSTPVAVTPVKPVVAATQTPAKPVATAIAAAPVPVTKAVAAPVAAEVAQVTSSASTASSTTSTASAASADSDADSKLASEEVFQLALKDAQSLIVVARAMVARVREMKKVFDRELKDSKKNVKKPRKVQLGGSPREPTGFAKPCKIKDSLADFLHDVAGNTDVKRGDMMTRTEVTKRLNAYIIQKGLRNPEDQRKIQYKSDSKLSPLITLPPDVSELTYFNLQTAIKDLFEKPAEAVSTSA